MSRLIDADALIKDIYAQSDDDGWFVVTAQDLEELVNGQPTADAVPERKKGRWELHSYMPHHKYCTICHIDSPYNIAWSFCPHCGASMTEGAES